MSARLAYLRLADEFELRRKEERNSFIFAIVPADWTTDATWTAIHHTDHTEGPRP